MRFLFLASVGVAFAAGAQTAEPIPCKVVATQATQRLMGAALEGEPATADEKRVFGEFQRGVIDECAKAAEANCHAPRIGEVRVATPGCPPDPVPRWMATSASQILPTQSRLNRATRALEGLLGKAPAPAAPPAAGSVARGPAAAPSTTGTAPGAPTATAPTGKATGSSATGSSATGSSATGSSAMDSARAPPAPPSSAAGVLTPPPPPPPVEPAPVQPPPASAIAEDAPVLEGDALLTHPLTHLSKRDLRGIQVLLEEKKPGLGLTIGMYAGGAGALGAGSFFIAVSVGRFGSTFGLLLGAAALTAGVVLVAIGTVALVSRLRTRALYNARLEEVRILLQKPARSAELNDAFPSSMVTIAQW